jgi:hypothetical protein
MPHMLDGASLHRGDRPLKSTVQDDILYVYSLA